MKNFVKILKQTYILLAGLFFGIASILIGSEYYDNIYVYFFPVISIILIGVGIYHLIWFIKTNILN